MGSYPTTECQWQVGLNLHVLLWNLIQRIYIPYNTMAMQHIIYNIQYLMVLLHKSIHTVGSYYIDAYASSLYVS